MAVTPKVLLKRSSVVGRVPSASDLQYGEIAINFVDGKIYYKDASNNVKAFIDSARVQAIAANEAGNFLDSAEAVALIDSAYVQLRQSYDYNSLSNKPNILDSADVLALAYDSGETQTLIFSLIDSSYIRSIQSYDADTLDGQDGTYYLDWTNVTNKPDLIDSALTLQLIDSSYIKNTIDSSYINLNVNQTTIENIIDATYINNNIDSAHIQSIINQDYITNTIDSSVIIRIVNENGIDSSDVIDLIDSDYLRNRVRQLISSVDQGGDGSFSYNQYTGVMTYTGPSAAEVRAHLVAGAGVTYDSATGVITGYTGFDSDFGTKTTDDLTEGSTNLYYTTARHDSDTLAQVDSSYVQARQDYAYSSLTGVPTNVSAFTNDANYLDSNTATGVIDATYIQANQITYDFLDSAEVVALVDSAYVQARQTPQDFAYSSLTGAPTNVSAFTNDANYIATGDSATLASVTTTGAVIVGGNLQVNGTTFTVNSETLAVGDNLIYMNQLESAGSPTLQVDVGWAANVNDNGTYTHVGMFRDATDDTFKVFGNYAPEPDSAVQIDTNHASFELAPFAAKTLSGEYLGFDSDLATKTTTDVAEGTNLYYTKARVDSDITASLNDSGNTVNITINNTITDTVDSAYVLARVAEAPFLDSADAIALINSAYVQARQITYNTSNFTDSAFVTGLPVSTFTNDANYLDSTTVQGVIDASYIQANQTTYDFLDSAEAIALIDSAYVQARQLTYDFLDSAEVIALIDSAYVAARSAAGGIDSAGVLSLIDSDYIELRRPAETIFNIVNNGASAYTFSGEGFSSSRDNPTLYLVRGKTYKFNMSASGHPFQIRVSNGGSAYSTGVTNNGAQTGDIFFTPDMNAPSNLVYQCTVHSGMVGDIVILDGTGSGGLDSAAIIELIDSAYVQAREAAGGGGGGSLDSGNIDTIVDSAYIKFRVDYDTDESLQFGKDQYALGTLTGSTSGTNIYTAFNPGQADGLFTSAYNYADGGVDIDQWVWGYYWVNSGLGYAQIATKADNGDGTYTYTTSPALSWAGGWTNYVVLADRPGGKDTPLKIRYNGASDAVEFNAKKQIRIYHSDESDRPLWINASYLDLNGSPAYFSNKFDSNSLFPSATDYPGMFATFDSNITNGPGGAYVSLEGQWTKISGSGVDSGEAKKIVLDVIDSDHFIPGKGERNWNITSDAPPEISTGDFWLDRDDLVLSKLTADNNWTSTLPSGSFSAEPGLTSFNWFTNSPGGAAASFNVSGGPVGSFEKTFVMGTSPYNSGGRYTFSNPVAFSYFNIGNTASGHIYSVGYTDGSYMVSNTGINGSKTATPSSYTWYNYDNTSMGHTVGNGSGTINLTHPNGTLAEYIIIGRNNYGTRNYNAWMFFAGGNTWQRVGEIYDSSDIKNLIDSAYINSKVTGGGGAGGGLDSAAVLSLIDSNYIASATGSGATISQTHFHFTADSGQTIFSGADDDSATLSYTANGIMVFLNGILLIDSVDYTAIDGSTVTLLDSASLSDIISIVKMSGSTSTGTDSAAVISLIDSAYVQARQTNVFNNIHVSGQDSIVADGISDILTFEAGPGISITTDLNTDTITIINDLNADIARSIIDSAYVQEHQTHYLDSALVTQLIDSAYVTARAPAGGGGGTVDSADIIAIVDSAYVQARQTSGGGGGGGGLDSALVSQLIDSDYIGTRVDFTRGEFTTERSQYTATAAQTVFNHSSIDATHLDVYINGVLQVVNDDYTADTSAVTFTAGVDSGYSVSIIERRGRVATQRGLVESKYYFTTPTPITSITGADDNGITLDYSIGNLDVYLNGILLKDSDDYSTNAGTTVTLISATDSNDLVTLINRKGVVVTPNVKNYEFNATAGQTSFSGVDINGNTLAYVPGAAQVFLNGILLRNVDYTGITGTSIVLVDSASLNDELVVSAFSNPGQNMDLYKFTADSGQTIFSGNDLTNASLAYQPGNIQVFMNGLLLNDSDDYTASNGMSVVLTSGADASDEIKIASFVTNADVIRTNAWSAPSGTPVTAAAGDKLFIDTSTAKTITLPSSATMGDEIRIIDVTGNAATNNITVARNGHKIQGGTTDLTINVDRAGIGLVYYNSAQGWVLIEN